MEIMLEVARRYCLRHGYRLHPVQGTWPPRFRERKEMSKDKVHIWRKRDVRRGYLLLVPAFCMCPVVRSMRI